MKYASSIRYGGQLVEASECDYNSYKHLGLLCPECKDAVFLRAEGARSHNGKEIKVAAHFAHFAGKDAAIVAQCESRVSKYTPKQLQKMAAQAKGQRLRLLQRWFWKIIQEGLHFSSAMYFYEDPRYGHSNEENRSFVAAELEQLKKVCSPAYLSKKMEDYQEAMTGIKEDAVLNGWRDGSSDRSIAVETSGASLNTKKPVLPTDLHLLDSIFEARYVKFDPKMESLICREVFEFLLCASSRPILEDLILIANYSPIKEGSKRTYMHCAERIWEFITDVWWSEEFVKLQAKGTAKAA